MGGRSARSALAISAILASAESIGQQPLIRWTSLRQQADDFFDAGGVVGAGSGGVDVALAGEVEHGGNPSKWE